MGPGAGLNGQKISSPPGFDAGPSSPWSVAIPTELAGPQHPQHSQYKIPTQPTAESISEGWQRCEGEGKSVPLQAWTGPEGSRKLRFPDYVKTAQDGGKVVSLTHRPPLTPGNTHGTHFC